MKPAPKRLVVLIPALNEAEAIGAVVNGVLAQQPALVKAGVALTVMVVDDGSWDGTGAIASQVGADLVIRHKINRGLGAAVRTGLQRARDEGFDLLLKLDADGQHDPADIPAMIAPILHDEAEVVYGSRFGRIAYRMPLVRRWGNAVFCALMRGLTGWPLKDSQPGIIAVSKDYLKVALLPGSYNYAQQVLLDAFHKGMRFAQVEVAFRERTSGRSFISLAYPFKALGQIFWLLVSLRPLTVFGPIGAAFLALGLGVAAWQMTRWAMGEAAKPVENVNLVLGSALFGLQTLFFGVLAELIVRRR
jgi:glycosyltransferase involved in cell wall biosynthesis